MRDVTRRRFYSGIIYGMGAAIGVAMAIPAVIYLFVPPKLRRHNGWVDAGDVSKLDPNEPVELAFQQITTDGWVTKSVKKTAWVVNIPGKGVIAYGPQCTHLGCAYHWETESKEFLCPCHTSIFSVDGKVTSGPAPRPLDRYESKVANNKLMLGPLKVSA